MQAVPSRGRLGVREPRGPDERSSNQGPLAAPNTLQVRGPASLLQGDRARDLLTCGRGPDRVSGPRGAACRPGKGPRRARARARALACVKRPGAHGAPPRRRGWPARAPFPALSAAARPAAACRCSALQEQKGELRKRLSYTTHKLEKLETEFDSTRHYLEIELRRAQEELEKVTEKLRRYGGRGRARGAGPRDPPPEEPRPLLSCRSRSQMWRPRLSPASCPAQPSQAGRDPGSGYCQDRPFPGAPSSSVHPFSCILGGAAAWHTQPSPDPPWPTGALATIPWVSDRKRT